MSNMSQSVIQHFGSSFRNSPDRGVYIANLALYMNIKILSTMYRFLSSNCKPYPLLMIQLQGQLEVYLKTYAPVVYRPLINGLKKSLKCCCVSAKADTSLIGEDTSALSCSTGPVRSSYGLEIDLLAEIWRRMVENLSLESMSPVFERASLTCLLLQGLSAPSLRRASLTLNAFGMKDQLDAFYECGPFNTSDKLKRLCIVLDNEGYDTYEDWYDTTKANLPLNMMLHLTKLTLAGLGTVTWLKAHTDAIQDLHKLQKLRVKGMVLTTDMLCQPFCALKW